MQVFSGSNLHWAASLAAPPNAMDDLRAFLNSYQDHLNDLRAPTRAAITALTMLAVEKASESATAASGIAAVVVNHVLTVRYNKALCVAWRRPQLNATHLSVPQLTDFRACT